MRQLSSPAPSARAVASWLIEKLHDPCKPLATVALLLSESDPQTFRNPRTGEDHAVEMASMANARQALREWGDRGQRTDDRLLFYFCGHGIANGIYLSLLMADFGESRYDPLESAIDFSRLLIGMEAIPAREQCFFVDACRANSETALGANGYMGVPVFAPDTANLPDAAPGVRLFPVYYSTVLGQDAYGLPHRRSPFTDALIRALDGAGGNNDEGDWRVSTTDLKKAIDFFMTRVFEAGANPVEWPATDNLTTFFLHYLDCEPEARVFVGCRPEAANDLADFSCLYEGAVRDHRASAPGDWELVLPPERYEFIADFPKGYGYQRATKTWLVYPPYRKVPLQVLP